MASPGRDLRPRLRLAASGRHEFFVAIAEALNFESTGRLPPWRDRAFGKAFRQKARRVHPHARRFYDRAEQAAQGGRDSAASDYLEPGNRWNPMIDATRPM